jgi:hypothetical protein
MKIKNDKAWFKDIWRKSVFSKTCLDEAITINAQWMLDNKNKP